jgi:hypothetical protein
VPYNCNRATVSTAPPPYGGAPGAGGFTQPHGPPPGADPQCAVTQCAQDEYVLTDNFAGFGLGSLPWIPVISLPASIMLYSDRLLPDRSGAINAPELGKPASP